MEKNKEVYTISCVLDGNGKQGDVTEWTYEDAVERACKVVDAVTKRKKEGQNCAEIKIVQHFIKSQRIPRLKFSDSVPLDNTRQTSKLFRLRRKQRSRASNVSVEGGVEESPIIAESEAPVQARRSRKKTTA